MQQVAAIRRSNSSYDEVLSDVKKLWADSDYVIGNLETPVAPSAPLASGIMTFNAPKAFAASLKTAGVDFVSLANNHCMDRGLNGLDETIRTLRSVGLEYSGAYLKKEDSERVYVKDVGGVRVALVCSTYGINGLDKAGLPLDYDWKVDSLTHGSITHVPERFKRVRRLLSWMIPEPIKSFRRALAGVRGSTGVSPICDSIHPQQIGRTEDVPCVERIRQKICRAREQADFVIALPHVGGQYNFGPGEFQKYTARWMVDAGAKVVIANHAHKPLRTEKLSNGAFVAYALGNFCFTPGVGYYVPNVLAEYSVVVNIFIDKENHDVDHISFHTVKSIVRHDGVSVVMPVYDLYSMTSNVRDRERLAMENEAVVNCFKGTAVSISVAEEYSY